jgi:hypothetical protein
MKVAFCAFNEILLIKNITQPGLAAFFFLFCLRFFLFSSSSSLFCHFSSPFPLLLFCVDHVHYTIGTFPGEVYSYFPILVTGSNQNYIGSLFPTFKLQAWHFFDVDCVKNLVLAIQCGKREILKSMS